MKLNLGKAQNPLDWLISLLVHNRMSTSLCKFPKAGLTSTSFIQDRVRKLQASMCVHTCTHMCAFTLGPGDWTHPGFHAAFGFEANVRKKWWYPAVGFSFPSPISPGGSYPAPLSLTTMFPLGDLEVGGVRGGLEVILRPDWVGM